MSKIYLKLLDIAHIDVLYEFECENREYFTSIGLARPDYYYNQTSFSAVVCNLLEEQKAELHKMYCIFDSDENLVGRINQISIAEDSAEIGYRIGQRFQGKGYATQALKQLLHLISANSKTKKMVAGCSADNLASQKVLINNGFVLLKHSANANALEDESDGLWYEKILRL